MFNNREIAIAVWAIVFTTWMMTQAKIRTSVISVVRGFFAWKLVACLAALALYVTTIAIALRAIGFWQVTMLKDTVIWFFFSAIAMIMRFSTSRKRDNILHELLFENLQLSIILEFIVDSYVMSFWVEIILVPVTTVLAMIMTVAQFDKKNAPAAKLSAFLLGIIGIWMFGFAVFRAIGDYRNLEILNVLRSIMLMPIMSILLFPFIYVTVCIVYYDDLFIRLNIGREKSPFVVRYAKRLMFSQCGLSLRRLRDLRSRPQEIMQIASTEDVDRILSSLNPVMRS